MTTTRTLCPLDCGWHHDQEDPTLDPATATMSLPTPDLAYILGLGRLHAVESILRAHLETHELIEWVTALQAAKQQLVDEKARQEAYEESVVGALNERNIRDARRAGRAEAQVARVRNFLEDMAGWCSPHGVAADYPRRGLDALDGVDPLELAGPTREELAAKAEVPSSAELAESLGFALAAMLPGAEPVFCHHEHAQRNSYTTHQAGWGRKTVRTVSCPDCKARAESTEGEPVLAPTVLNAERCTEACTERHTNGPGCLMAPDWSKPTLTAEQLARLDQDGVDTKGCDCGHPGMGVAWHLGWCTWRKGQENHGPDSPASGSRR